MKSERAATELRARREQRGSFRCLSRTLRRVPAPLGPLIGFSLGALLARLGAREGDADSRRRARRQSGAIALFAALVYAPICAYFLVFAPDWSLAYIVDSRSVPSVFALVLVAADAASVIVGAELTRRLARRGAPSAAAAIASAAVASALLFLVIYRARLRVEGSFQQVQHDYGTRPVFGGPLGYAIVWMALVLAAGFALTLRTLRAEPRPLPSPTTSDVDASPSVFHP